MRRWAGRGGGEGGSGGRDSERCGGADSIITSITTCQKHARAPSSPQVIAWGGKGQGGARGGSLGQGGRGGGRVQEGGREGGESLGQWGGESQEGGRERVGTVKENKKYKKTWLERK